MKKGLSVLLSLLLLLSAVPASALADAEPLPPEQMEAEPADLTADEYEELLSGTMQTDGTVTNEEEPSAVLDMAEPELQPQAVYADGQTVEHRVALLPDADAYVQDGSGKTNNFGSSGALTVRGTYYRIPYLRFDLTETAGEIQSATLRLYKTKGSADTLYITTADSNDWEEMEISYVQQPGFDRNDLSMPISIPGSNNTYVEIDVTELVSQMSDDDRRVTFVIFATAGANNIDFRSKEQAANRPQLVIESTYTPQPRHFQLDGDPTVIVPAEGESAFSYGVSVTDHYGEAYQPQALSWEVQTADGAHYDGVQIADGVMTIGAQAASGTGYLVITADGVEYRTPLSILTEGEAAHKASEEFDLGDVSYVYKDLDLPAKGAYRTEIAWVSSDGEFLTNDGQVTRPATKQGDIDVVLTATFTCGLASVQREFPVHIVRQSVEIMLLPDDGGTGLGGNTLQGGSGADKPLKGLLQLRYDKYRMGILKYDLSGIEAENILSARLEFDGGRVDVRAANVTRDDWDPKTITYNIAQADGLLGNIVYGDGYLNDASNVEIDLTQAVKDDFFSDENKIFSVYLYSTLLAETNFSFGSKPRLYIDAVYDPVPTSVKVDPVNRNETYIARPLSGVMRAQYIGTVIDQNGGLMLSEEIVWQVENAGAQVVSRGILGEVDEWPKSDIVVPVGLTGRDICEISITPQTKAIDGAVQLTARAKSVPDLSATLPVEIRDSIPNTQTHPYVLHGKEDLSAIRERVKSNPLSASYAADKMRANQYTVEELQPENIYQISPWRPLTFAAFTVPKGVHSAEIGFFLEGAGEVGFDSASLLSIDSDAIELKNQSFETGLSEPNNWRFVQWKGGGAVSYERVSSGIFRAWNGSRYIKVTNTDMDDLTGVVYDEDLYLTPGAHYTFTVNVSQLDKLKSGSFVVVRYKDENGNYMTTTDEDGNETPLEQWSQAFNRITFTKRNAMPGIEYANVYMIEDNVEYAEKSKLSLLYFLYDSQWGMQYWINTGTNLDDTYQAVHIGRRLYDWAVWYDRFADSGVISEEEDNIIRSKMYWIAETLLDTKYYDYTDMHSRRHNFNTDRSNGLMAFSIAFPEYARSKELYNHAKREIMWQLSGGQNLRDPSVTDAPSVGKDGSWPECVRYHAAVLTKIFSSAPALKRHGDTEILDMPEFKQMSQFLINIQTPRDLVNETYYNGALYPAVGDTQWGDATGVLPFIILTYADSDDPADIDLVRRAKYAYIRQNDQVGIVDYFTDMDVIDEIIPMSPKLQSDVYDDAGFIIFRQDYGLPKEDYVLVQASSPNIIGSHQNNDRGAFSMFADNTPIMLDAGVGSYTDGSGEWYSISSAHNMVSFYDGDAEMSLGEKTGTIEYFQADPFVDHTKIGVPDTSAVARHKRNFAYVKGGFDMLLVSDSIRMSSDKDSKINFHVLGNGVSVNGNTATMDAYNYKHVDITVMEPRNPEFDVLRRGLVAGNYPTQGEAAARQDHIQVANTSGGDYFSIIYPRDEKAKGLKTVLLAESGNMSAYQITNPDGESIVAVVNNDTVATTGSGDTAVEQTPVPQTISFASNRELVSAIDYAEVHQKGTIAASDADGMAKGVIFTPVNGEITISLDPSTIQVLAPAELMEQTPVALTVNGLPQLQIPTNDTAVTESYYEAVVYDQNGHAYDTDKVVYSVSGNGVSIDPKSGLLSVSSKASGTAVVTARLGELSNVQYVRLTPSNVVLKSIEIIGSDTLLIPQQGVYQLQYRAELKDPYGTVVSGQKINWSVDGELPDGVSFQRSDGTISVRAGAAAGESFLLKATADLRPSLFSQIKITLSDDNSIPSSVVITGPDTVTAGSDARYQAKVRNQAGQTMPEQIAAFSVSGSSGASMEEHVLKVASDVAAGTKLEVKAVCGDAQPAITTVTVKKRTTDGGTGGSGGSGRGGSGRGGSSGGGGITPIAPIPNIPSVTPPENTRFVDMDSVPWAREAVDTLADLGIVNGRTKTEFAPNDPVKREEFVKILLGALEIAVKETTTADFVDVQGDSWYAPYVGTAQELGITTGRDDGSFGVGESVAREDMAVLAARAAAALGKELEYQREPAAFADAHDISGYAADAVAKLYAAGIINGRTDTEFAPHGISTRAESAVMLYRLYTALAVQD